MPWQVFRLFFLALFLGLVFFDLARVVMASIFDLLCYLHTFLI